MPINKPRPLLELEYYEAAQAYLRSLPPEHFMEATAQATQRKITLESLDLVQAQRPEVQVFNELLVQYPLGRTQRIRQVVPDNMVVVHPEPIRAEGSYDVVLQPVAPYWALEYVSKSNKRKDYEDSFRKYERELKIPYYLLFYLDNQELSLFKLRGRRYLSVPENEVGRHPLTELELEIALEDGWVRYWYQGKLLPLPADLLHRIQELQERNAHLQERTEQLQERNEQLQERTEQLMDQLEQERREKERLLAELRRRNGGH